MNKIIKYILCCFLFFYVLSTNAYTQTSGLGREVKDSLDVFIVKDKNVATKIDNFLLLCEKDYKEHYPSVIFGIDINLYDDGGMILCIDLMKKRGSSDSIILYRNTYLQQAFILHRDVLFQFTFASIPYANPLNYCRLVDMLEKRHTRQCVYIEEAPDGFYDTNRKGDLYIEDNIMSWGWDYIDGEWRDGIYDD